MKTRHLAIGLLALAACLWTSTTVPVHGAEPDGAWYAFYVAGGKAGYLHMTTTKGEENGQTVWTTETELSFSLSRLGSPMTILQKETVVEDENGQVLRFSMVMDQGMGPQETKGTVADGKISIVQSGMTREAAYPEGALGPAHLERQRP